MKRPQPARTPVDLPRLRAWVQQFAAYRDSIPEERIRDWLRRFDDADVDLAARVLDSVELFSHQQIVGAFRSILNGLEGWNRAPTRRRGRWRFVAYSSSAGESGDSMLDKFRHANNLKGKEFNELFIGRSDILREGLNGDDTVVLVDDFVGTGTQACDYWNELYGEILANVGRVYLVVVAACAAAIQRVADETDIEVVPHHHLTSQDDLFSNTCTVITQGEKDTVLRYCTLADPKQPKGFGECGLLVVFAHGCPNNSIPILHASRSAHWEGLFRRYD